MAWSHTIAGLATAVVTIAVDQASKVWVQALFQDPELRAQRFVEVLPFLNITLTYNRGVSFGLLAADSDTGRYALAGFGLLASALILWMLIRSRRVFSALGLGLVLGGAIGNVWDRLTIGAVVDFIDAHFAGWHFWTFNIADSAITVGVICLLIDIFIADEAADQPVDQTGRPD